MIFPIRRRRLSVNKTPPSINLAQYGTVAFHYDAYDFDFSGTTDGTAIARWEDKSGNNRYLSQTPGQSLPITESVVKPTNCPTYQVKNGYPSVYFNGVDMFFYQNFPGNYLVNSIYMAIEWRNNLSNTYSGIFCCNFVAGTFQLLLLNEFGNTQILNNGFYSNTNGTGASFKNGISATTFELNKKQSILATNTGVSPTTISAQMLIGRDRFFSTHGNRYLFGNIYEMIGFEYMPNPVNDIELYLKNKWGVPN